ncbi:uncharacterized protein B0P05DRAFT_567234 [Gilbertella persicaria]|uniref:uncharacterized protein n=1 Tax=Gilbertella persicaria TaxID=101096 RepID=UPI0022202068|nr:uncharacterized protein B0P05DRAFT_567234 [Gilbertella persicaria]KAI8047015.1 hypothetical protein B0P05DRAFT_567234 [Gilbertella persicaria]
MGSAWPTGVLGRRELCLKKELAAARSRILELESQAGSSTASPLENDQVAAPSSSVSPSAAGSKWAQSDSLSVAKAKPKARITPKQRKAAARIFLVSSPAATGTCVDGPLYEYVYLPNKYRDRLSAFRRKLRLIGLDNSRVLDVHYPAPREFSARLVRALGISANSRRQVAYDFVRQAGSVVGPSPLMDFTLAGDGEPVSSS